MSMSKLIFVLFTLLKCILTEIKQENGILILNSSNFNQAIKDNNILLVYFFSPQCPHCKLLDPEYQVAADILKKAKPSLPLAKIDATAYTYIPKQYNVKGYPAILLFVEGKHIEYEGPRTSKDISEWMRKKVSPPSKLIKSAEEAQKLVSERDSLILYIGAESHPNFIVFTNVSLSYYDVEFAHCTNNECRRHYDVEDNSVIVLKNFDEKRNNFTEQFNDENLRSFIERYAYPRVKDLTDRTVDLLFTKPGSHIIVVFREDDDDAKYREVLQQVSEKVDESYGLVVTNLNSTLAEKIADFVGITNIDLPCLRLLKIMDDNILKYTFEAKINEENLIKYINDFENGIVPNYYKTEAPIPQTADVIDVVGSNFEDIVIRTAKSVVMLYYAPDDQHSQSLMPLYEKIAQRFSSYDSLKIGRMNVILNEAEKAPMDTFPLIVFYPSTDKDDSSFYEGDYSFDDIVSFIQENLGIRDDL